MNELKIICGTGHRLNKIGGFKLPNPTYNFICQETERILLEEKPDKVISGAAIGYDQFLAFIAMKLGIKVLFAIPFIGQEKIWPKESQDIYHKLLSKADEIVIVSDGEYSAQKMMIRNQYMVDNSTKVLACYNGDQFGGTYQCINYAKSKNKEIIYIDPTKAPIKE